MRLVSTASPSAAIDIGGVKDVAILSGGTDGSDGPTDVAGAMATGETLAQARKLNLDATAFLTSNDSYTFFEAAGGVIKTGPTKTNVMDVRIILAGQGR